MVLVYTSSPVWMTQRVIWFHHVVAADAAMNVLVCVYALSRCVRVTYLLLL